jgi:hypothetical protein
LFLFRNALHLHGEQLAGRSHSIFATAFSSSLSLLDRLALENGGAAIKDKDRLDAEPEELAYTTKETDYMRVAQSVSFPVAHSFEELVNPDGRINGETLAIESREVRGPSAWLDNGPEAVNTHDGMSP